MASFILPNLNMASNMNTAINLVREKYPTYKYFGTNQDKSFAGTSIETQSGRNNNYYVGMIAHGSGVPIVEITCFSVNLNTKEVMELGKGVGIDSLFLDQYTKNNFDQVFDLSACQSLNYQKTQQDIADRIKSISIAGFAPDVFSVRDTTDQTKSYLVFGFFVSPYSSLATLIRQGYDCYEIQNLDGKVNIKKIGEFNDLPVERMFDAIVEYRNTLSLEKSLDPKVCKMK